MKTTRILAALVVALASAALSSCQAVPAERKNNCACLWEPLEGPINIAKGTNA